MARVGKRRLNVALLTKISTGNRNHGKITLGLIQENEKESRFSSRGHRPFILLSSVTRCLRAHCPSLEPLHYPEPKREVLHYQALLQTLILSQGTSHGNVAASRSQFLLPSPSDTGLGLSTPLKNLAEVTKGIRLTT